MDNRPIAERVFELQRVIRGRNDATAMAVQRAIIPLLEYAKPLVGIKREALLRLDRVNQKSVDLILRVIAGEAIDAIAASAPATVRNPKDGLHHASPRIVGTGMAHGTIPSRPSKATELDIRRLAHL